MKCLVSIVILTHNGLEATRWCVAGLRETTYPSLEVIFVDNGSSDGTVPFLRDVCSSNNGPPCRLIENRENVGCSTARNQGAAQANGEFVVFLDNDVIVRTKRWIEILLRAFRSEGVGAASPKLIFPFPPHLIQFAGGAVSPTGKVQFMGRGEPRTAPEHNEAIDLQCTISACMMMPVSVFREANGFDEAFNPVQFEDIDLSYTIRHNGYRIRYVPAAELYHIEGSTTQDAQDVRGTYQIIRNGLLFKKRWVSMFSREDGPAEESIAWANIEKHNLCELSGLEYV